MCFARSSYDILKTTSTVSVYYDAASDEPFFDPSLVGLIFERRREICLELFESLVRFHAEIVEPHYEVIRDTLLEADVPVQDQYDQACSFYLDDATTRFDQIIMSTSYVVPIDQRFFRCYERLQQTVAILWNTYRNYTKGCSLHHETETFNKLCEHPGTSSEHGPTAEHSMCNTVNIQPKSVIVQLDRQKITHLPDLLYKTCKQVEALVQFLEFYQYVKERRILAEAIAQSQNPVPPNEKPIYSREILRAYAQLVDSQGTPGTSQVTELQQASEVNQEEEPLPVFEDPILEQLRKQLEDTCRKRKTQPPSRPMRDSELDLIMLQRMESLYRFLDSGSEISISKKVDKPVGTQKEGTQIKEHTAPQIEEVSHTLIVNNKEPQDSLQGCVEVFPHFSHNEPKKYDHVSNSETTQLDNNQDPHHQNDPLLTNVVDELSVLPSPSILEPSNLPIPSITIANDERTGQSSLEGQQLNMHSANPSYTSPVLNADLQVHPEEDNSPPDTQDTYESIDNACVEELFMSDVTDISSASDFKFY